MNAFETIGVDHVACKYPREVYRPADLTGEQHKALWEMLRIAASFDGLNPEAAEEAASKMYLHWLTRNYSQCDIARGDHARAYWAIRRYAKRSHWQGFTGQRRDRKATERAKILAARARLREQYQPTPASVAVAVERIATSPAYGRKAYRLAQKIGLPGVRELVRAACGFGAE